MPEKALQLDPRDNVIVALSTLEPGAEARYAGSSCPVAQTIPAKQKMALAAFNPGDLIVMYGMVVGEVVQPIPRGGLITTQNIRHRTGAYTTARQPAPAARPDASAWKTRTFLGYHRADGQVGTRNYWIVVPLGLLRKPQRRADARGTRRRARLRPRQLRLPAARAAS